MRKSIWLAVVIALVTTVASAALNTRETVVVDDHRMAYIQRGDGVTVVFESGLGDGVAPWSQVFEDVSRFAHAFAYDRPGYGNSGRALTPRDGAHVVVELHELLRAANAKPPYVLVGHSLGGMFAELYARTYPAETAALVLVEARPADFTRRCQQQRAAGCEVPAWMASFMPPSARAELESLDATQRALVAAPPLREDLPLVVVSAGRHLVEGTRWSQLWDAMQRELAARSTRAHQIVVERSGHYVQRDAPKTVIEAIREAVKMATQPRT